MTITSCTNEKIKELVKLKEKKYRDSINKFFVEGIDLCNEAYKNNLLEHIYILEDNENIYENIPCTYVSYEVMKKISDMESISPYYGVCKKIENKQIGNKLLILDNLQDPGNLGTIIRSAVAFNFDNIIISKNSVDLYNPKTIRSTKGMLFNINILICDIKEFISNLSEYTIYGTDVVNGNNIKNINLENKIGIVIGNEGKGISEEIRTLCNKFIYINMNEKCESLNASVAASIIMYEVNNKKNK